MVRRCLFVVCCLLCVVSVLCSLYGVGCVSFVDCDYLFGVVVVRCLLCVGLLFVVCCLLFMMRVGCRWLMYLVCFLYSDC